MKIEDSDYIAITDSTVLSVTPEGIHYTGGFISFLECATNYKEAHGGSGNCVGERYADDRPVNFVFYTAPKTTHLYFPEQSGIKKLFSGGNAYQRFYQFHRQITKLGFSTMDMS